MMEANSTPTEHIEMCKYIGLVMQIYGSVVYKAHLTIDNGKVRVKHMRAYSGIKKWPTCICVQVWVPVPTQL